MLVFFSVTVLSCHTLLVDIIHYKDLCSLLLLLQFYSFPSMTFLRVEVEGIQQVPVLNISERAHRIREENVRPLCFGSFLPTGVDLHLSIPLTIQYESITLMRCPITLRLGGGGGGGWGFP